MNKRNAVIFDMDGTLVDVRLIRHYVMKENKKDFKNYHEKAMTCPPHDWVVRAAKDVHKQGFDVLIVTAREDKWRKQAEFWLAANEVPHHALFMRKTKDNRKDSVIKKSILKEIKQAGWNPILAFDDNPHIITMWTENDIPTIQVQGWIEGFGND